MGDLAKKSFYDYGNTPEVLIESKAIPEWELLECGLIRVFICKSVQDKPILDHTDLMTPDVMEAVGKRFIEIAAAARQLMSSRWAAAPATRQIAH